MNPEPNILNLPAPVPPGAAWAETLSESSSETNTNPAPAWRPLLGAVVVQIPAGIKCGTKWNDFVPKWNGPSFHHLQKPNGVRTPSPPLEERAGERRPHSGSINHPLGTVSPDGSRRVEA